MASIVDERRAQMFPTLSPAQISRLLTFGEKRSVTAGQIVFEQGDASRTFTQ